MTNGGEFNAPQRGIDPALIHEFMLIGDLTPCCLKRRAALPFGLVSGQYGSNYPDNDSCCPVAAEILVSYRQMRAQIKALDPSDQFQGSTAYSAAIIAFEFAALLSPWAGDASLHRDDNITKQATAGFALQLDIGTLLERRRNWVQFQIRDKFWVPQSSDYTGQSTCFL